jgi:hypothetical protein
MKTITKSVIKLSEIPEELQKTDVFYGQRIHTYAEFHIDKHEHDPLTLWLLEKYPTLSRKISFLIHIDQEPPLKFVDLPDGLVLHR